MGTGKSLRQLRTGVALPWRPPCAQADAAGIFLCRIGIMARGQLRCIGTGLHLKSRFGSGYRVSVRVLGNAASATVLVNSVDATASVEEHSQREPLAQKEHLKRIFMQRLGVKSGECALSHEMGAHDLAVVPSYLNAHD